MKHKSTHEWGRETAKARHAGSAPSGGGSASGEAKKAIIGLINQPTLDETGREMQAPQAVNDHHGAGYDNDASGWVRGVGKPHPHFDSKREGKP